jgi:hypothetical protein
MVITGINDYTRLDREREQLIAQTRDDERIFAETLALAVRHNLRRGRTTDELADLRQLDSVVDVRDDLPRQAPRRAVAEPMRERHAVRLEDAPVAGEHDGRPLLPRRADDAEQVPGFAFL